MKLHKHPQQSCPCTCLAKKDDESFVSAGEDGQLAIVKIENKRPAQIIGIVTKVYI